MTTLSLAQPIQDPLALNLDENPLERALRRGPSNKGALHNLCEQVFNKGSLGQTISPDPTIRACMAVRGVFEKTRLEVSLAKDAGRKARHFEEGFVGKLKDISNYRTFEKQPQEETFEFGDSQGLKECLEEFLPDEKNFNGFISHIVRRFAETRASSQQVEAAVAFAGLMNDIPEEVDPLLDGIVKVCAVPKEDANGNHPQDVESFQGQLC